MKKVFVIYACAGIFICAVLVVVNLKQGGASTSAPALPVLCSSAKLAGQNGLVLKIANQSARELFCSATVKNSTAGKVWRLDILPGKSAQIGEREGWPVFPGDRFAVEAQGFATVSGEISQ